MRVLLVHLGSLGEVVQALPAVHDIRQAFPEAVVDWVVAAEQVRLVRRVAGVRRVLGSALPRWRRAWWTGATRREWRAFRAELKRDAYDVVIDLQGLAGSAALAHLARGLRFGIANRTEGSEHDALARWLVDHALRIEPHIHRLDRARVQVAAALGRPIDGPPVYGLQVPAAPAAPPTVVFVHGSAHDERLWPVESWVALGKRLIGAGWRIALPQGSEAEQTQAELIAAGLQYERAFHVEVWPALAIDVLLDRLGATQGAIGVDSALSHLAAALDLPLVQLHNRADAWRTGPLPGHGRTFQVALQGPPVPALEAVWSAWQGVLRAAREA